MGNQDMITNALLGGSSFVLVIMLLFGFGGTDNVVDVTIHFGMSMDTAEGQMHVYTNIPHPAHVLVKLYGFTRINTETNETEEVGLTDFFPSGDEPNTGYAGSSFDIALIGYSEMPALNLTQDFIPMVYVREVKRNAIEQMVLCIAAFTLNNWMLVKWSLILGMVGALAGAVGIQFQRQKEVVEVMTITTTN